MNIINKFTTTYLLLSLFFSGICKAEGLPLETYTLPGNNGNYEVLKDYPFVIISDYDVQEAPVITDSLFNTISYGVTFVVNKTDLNPKSDFFTVYNNLLPILKREGYTLRKLYVRGAASPDGPYANNQRLGRERTANLQKFIEESLKTKEDYSSNTISADHVAEDYGYLVTLMKDAGDKDYERVLKVYQNCNKDEKACKTALMRMDQGRLWKRLFQEYFPKLRSARIIMWLVKPAPIPEPEIVPEPEPVIVDTVVIEPEPVDTPQVTIPLPEPEYERRHLIAVRTNLLHDFFYMPNFGWAYSPNIQLEYYPKDGHYTYNAGLTWGTNRRWNSYQFWQIRDIQLELRRYFKGHGDFTGLYAGVYAHGGKYGIGLTKEKGWQGEYGGAGLSLGYVLPLTKKGNFRLELMLSAGMIISPYDPYVYGNPITKNEDGLYYYNYYGSANAFKKRNHMFNWFGPTNAGIQLTYDIIYRKKHLKGADL